MNKRRILILDNDQKNLKVLEMNFQAASYMVATAVSNLEAIGIIQREAFDIVLCELSAPSIDGYQLLKEIQRNPSRNTTSVIFLSIKSDVWNRVKSLKLGAKDFIVKPIHVSEIVARVNMVQSRMEGNRDKQAERNNTFSGRLEDLAVIDLVEVFGAEKKTGVLSLNNENGHSGQIIFNKGNVVSASAETLRADEAAYKMIYWNRGRFSMLFTDVQVEDEFPISNMGLLLQGAKRMDLRNELLKQLPSLDAIVITTSNFKKIISQKDINNELREFMMLFDGERSLGRIIDDSHENEIVTLKRIVKLYKLGFLHVLRDFTTDQPVQFKAETPEEEFSEYVPAEKEAPAAKPKDEFPEMDYDPDHEIDKVVPDNFPGNKNNITKMPDKPPVFVDDLAEYGYKKSAPEQPGAGGLESPKTSFIAETKNYVMMISTSSANNKVFVQSLTSGEPEVTHLPSSHTPIFHGAVNFRGGQQLHLVSVNPNEQFAMMLDYFHARTLGCIFLLDLDQMNWSYHRYLFKILSKQLQVPTLVIGKQSRPNSDVQSQDVRDKLGLADGAMLRFITEVDADNCRRVLFTLLNELEGPFHYTRHNEPEKIK